MATRFKLDENIPRDAIALLRALMRGALALLATETPQGRLWIIEEGRVRIRD